jgi:ribonuclease BN (tRNA processing enzyme)
MRLRVVGSSGTFPAYGRPASGYLIEQGSTRVWCDAGFGTFMSLPVATDLIDAIVISHQHPDHCADLMAAFHAWTYRPEPRDPVPLYGPEPVWERLTSFVGQEPACFDFIPVWTGDVIEIGELGVSFVEMDHSVPTVGSRWDGDGRTLFFTGDTGPGGEWSAAAEEVDLLLSEASYQESSKNADYPHHLSAAEAGEIARRVGAERLMLTHIPPYLEMSLSVAEAEERFDRAVSLAVPGASFDV